MRFERLSEWLSWQEKLHPNAIDLGLGRVQRTLERLQVRLSCPVITVGGTNGKGSCVALTTRILSAAGYRVGTFTSPHLLRYNERITIAEREVSDASLVEAFERIDAARGEDTLTFFEFNTLAALLVFETAGVDVIVLEVGMGGRLDAVNVIDADAALVTSIALDHCDWLGPDLETIGREKAGIFRAGRPAVFGARAMPNSIAEAATQLRSELRRLGRDFDWSAAGERWHWRGWRGELRDLPRPALPGDVQFENAAAVLAVLHSMSERLPVAGDAIEQGLNTVRLPGRFQVVAGPVTWILDVAHNPAAVHVLAAALRARASAGRTIAVLAILADKDSGGAIAEIQSCIDEWIVARLDGPRALDERVLAERVRVAGGQVARVCASVREACVAARERAKPGDRVVVFGSFLTVGAAMEWLQL
jgi:dihydrofolate synthase/folylpolyglutamate synthase